MFTRKPRLQLEKFAIHGAKRLLQHNLPTPVIQPQHPGDVFGQRYDTNDMRTEANLGAIHVS